MEKWLSFGIGSIIMAGGAIWFCELVWTNVSFLGSVALSSGMVWFGYWVAQKSLK